jgi:Pyruvate/2-oxoacid:ferredoxin oxidoreductase delta subunit/thioredoxin reductase
VLDRELGSILGLGVETRTGVDLDAAAIRDLGAEYDAVILATGLQSLRGLQVPGADLAGIQQGIDFLHRINLESPQTRLEGHVVVLGGGNTAMDCARSALRCGAESVSVAYRRTRAEMPAIAEEIELAAEEGIWLLYQVAPVAFLGDETVSALEVAEVEMGEPDDTGRRRPITTDRRRTIPCSQVLLALGQSADLGLLDPGWRLEDGQVFEGSKPLPIFAAGDIATGEGTVTHAVGNGRRAAGLALRHLNEDVEVFVRPDREHAVAATDIRFDHFAPAPPIREKMDPPAERIHRFEPVSHGLESALEAHRCFSCGHCTHCDTCLVYCPEGSIHRKREDYDVDYSYCKGCGICVAECPRAGMEMADL